VLFGLKSNGGLCLCWLTFILNWRLKQDSEACYTHQLIYLPFYNKNYRLIAQNVERKYLSYYDGLEGSTITGLRLVALLKLNTNQIRYSGFYIPVLRFANDA